MSIEDLNSYQKYIDNIDNSNLTLDLLQEITPKPKKFRGMTFIEFKWVAIDKMVAKQNKGRYKDACINKVSEFTTMIKNDGYRPYHHIPPSVSVNEDGTYELQNGFHRYRGHENAKKTHMWVAIVKLADEATAIEYANFANMEDENIIQGTVRSIEDIVKTSILAMKARNEEPTQENIQEQIKVLKAVTLNKKNDNKIYNSILEGFEKTPETLFNYDVYSGIAEYRKLTGDKSSHVVSTTHALNSRDKVIRSIRKLAEYTASDNKVPPLVLSVNGAFDTPSVWKSRVQFQTHLMDWDSTILEYAKMRSSGVISDDDLVPVLLPQTEAEVSTNSVVSYSSQPSNEQ